MPPFDEQFLPKHRGGGITHVKIR